MTLLLSPKQKFIAIGIAVAALLLIATGIKMDNWARAKFMKPIATAANPKALPKADVLKADESEKILVDPMAHRTTIVTGKGVKTVTGVRGTTITVKKDGTVSVVVKDKGLILEPGMSVFADRGAKFGLDAGVAYYHRLDLIVGIGFDKDSIKNTVGYLALGYTPSFAKLSNVDVFAGIDQHKDPLVGVRVRF